MSEARTFSYQTRIPAIDIVNQSLEAYANLYGKIERNLFVDLIKPHDLSALKKKIIWLSMGLPLGSLMLVESLLKGR